MNISPCHAERGKNGPSASDLEVAITGFIPAPGSQGKLHYKLQQE